MRVLALVFLILAQVSTVSATEIVFEGGPGAEKCEHFIAGPWSGEKLTTMEWISGFLSGLNWLALQREEASLAFRDLGVAMQGVLAYCHTNPEMQVGQAAGAYADAVFQARRVSAGPHP
jgi:hypothetical protein